MARRSHGGTSPPVGAPASGAAGRDIPNLLALAVSVGGPRRRGVRRRTGCEGVVEPVGTLLLPMASLMTSVERLSPSKVRLHVAVPEAEFEKAIDKAFRG